MYQGGLLGSADGNVGLQRPTPREVVGLYPTTDECLLEILIQTRHSSAVEYFKHHLKHGSEDLQTPHDLIGKGNKFEPEVLRYLALEHRVPVVDPEIIQIGVQLHREGQEHHRRINGYRLSPGTTDDFLSEGMVDVACAIRENRKYAKQRANNYHDVNRIFRSQKQPIHKVVFMASVIGELLDLERQGYAWPNLELITEEEIIGDRPLPNHFELPDPVHRAIDERTKWAVAMVRSGGYERVWREIDSRLVVPV